MEEAAQQAMHPQLPPPLPQPLPLSPPEPLLYLRHLRGYLRPHLLIHRCPLWPHLEQQAAHRAELKITCLLVLWMKPLRLCGMQSTRVRHQVLRQGT